MEDVSVENTSRRGSLVFSSDVESTETQFGATQVSLPASLDQDVREVPRLLRMGFTGRFATEFVNLLVMIAVFTGLIQASEAVGKSVALLVIGVAGGILLTLVSVSGMSINLRGRRATSSATVDRDWIGGFAFFLNVLAGLFTIAANIVIFVDSISVIAAQLLLSAAVFVAANELIGLTQNYIWPFIKWLRARRPEAADPNARKKRRIIVMLFFPSAMKLVAACILIGAAGWNLDINQAERGNAALQNIPDIEKNPELEPTLTDAQRDHLAKKDFLVTLNWWAFGIGTAGYVWIGVTGLVLAFGIARKGRRGTGRTHLLAELNAEASSLWIGSFSRFAGEIVRILAFLSIIFLMYGIGADLSPAGQAAPTITDGAMVARAFAVTFGGMFVLAGFWLMIGSLYRFAVQNEPLTGSAWFLTALTRIIAGAAIMTGGILALVVQNQIQYPLTSNAGEYSVWLNHALRVATIAWAIQALSAAILGFVRMVLNVYEEQIGFGRSLVLNLLDFLISGFRFAVFIGLTASLFNDPPRDYGADLGVVAGVFGAASLLNLIYGFLFDQESVVYRRWEASWRSQVRQQARDIPPVIPTTQDALTEEIDDLTSQREIMQRRVARARAEEGRFLSEQLRIEARLRLLRQRDEEMRAQQPERPGDVEMGPMRGSNDDEADDERSDTETNARSRRRDSMVSVPDAPTNEERDRPSTVSQGTTRTDDQPASRVDE